MQIALAILAEEGLIVRQGWGSFAAGGKTVSVRKRPGSAALIMIASGLRLGTTVGGAAGSPPRVRGGDE
jgi:hypothetical protein